MRRETAEGWKLEAGVLCVSCPRCAFTFDAAHEDTYGDGGHRCPACGERDLEAELGQRARVEFGVGLVTGLVGSGALALVWYLAGRVA